MFVYCYGNHMFIYCRAEIGTIAMATICLYLIERCYGNHVFIYYRTEIGADVREGGDGRNHTASRRHETPESARGQRSPVHRQILPTADILLILHRLHLVSKF